MKNKVLIILAFCTIYSISVHSQYNKALVKSDSLMQQGAHKAALDILNQTINDHPSRFVLSQAYYQLSYVYMQMFNFEKAAYFNQQSLNLRKRLRYEFIAGNYMRFGTIELIQGNHEKALDFFLQATELPYEDVQFSGILDGYIASAYARLKNPEKALKYQLQSLETLTSELGDIHPDVSTSYYNLGNLYWSMEETAKAEEAYLKSFEIEEKLGSENANIRAAKTHNALGMMYFSVFENYRLAFTQFSYALKASKGKPIRQVALSLINLAAVALKEEDFPEADRKLTKVMRFLSPDDDPDPENFIPMILDKSIYSRALALKNKLIVVQNDGKINQDKLIEILKNSELAVEVLESAVFDKYDENQQLHFLESNGDVYENVISIALELFQRTKDNSYQEKAFEYAERGKALVLKKMMHDFEAVASSRIDEKTLNEEKQILQSLAYFETHLAQKYEDKSFKKELLQLHNSHKRWLSKIEKAYPDYYQMKYRMPSPGLANVQKNLDDETALLSYYMGAEDYYIFVVSANDLESFQISSQKPSEAAKPGKERISFFKRLLKNKKVEIPEPGIYTQYNGLDKNLTLVDATNMTIRSLRKVDTRKFANYSHELYLRLIKPIKSKIRKKKNLVIIPHKELHYLPFEALISKAPKEGKVNYKKLNYLVKKYAVSYHLSADLYSENKGKKTVEASNNFLAFAPVFNPKKNTGYIWNSHEYVFDTTYHTATDLRSISKDGKGFNMLEHSENEVLKISELFAKQGASSKAFLHEKATEERFKSEAGNYKYVHIASHSFANKINPKLSGIAFAQPTESTFKEDGILYSAETFLLDLSKTDLLVLSSCESGFGKLSTEEGLLSLNRGFIYAGVNNTISSVWKVSDKNTALLMTSFYQQLINGKSYSNALRLAKLKMIKGSKTADPRKWAVFKLTGS